MAVLLCSVLLLMFVMMAVVQVHAEIKYDHDNSCYTVEDLGSQNGTFVNDLRISQVYVNILNIQIPLTRDDMWQGFHKTICVCHLRRKRRVL